VAVINENVDPNLIELNEYKEVKVTCPICKTEKVLKFPKTVINQAKQLTTISLPKGLVCDHHFQAFVDKNFVVRGYQKVDFEFAYDVVKKNNPDLIQDLEKDYNFYDNLILEGNYVEYNLMEKQRSMENENSNKKPKKMTLKEIYEEFWEYIDENNDEFKVFVHKDPRRK
jgi:hypothetical protein